MAMDNEIEMVQKEPLILLLCLPAGCCPWRWEAAESFAKIIAEMKAKHPDKSFQLLPFSYATVADGIDPALNSILAIAT